MKKPRPFQFIDLWAKVKDEEIRARIMRVSHDVRAMARFLAEFDDRATDDENDDADDDKNAKPARVAIRRRRGEKD